MKCGQGRGLWASSWVLPRAPPSATGLVLLSPPSPMPASLQDGADPVVSRSCGPHPPPCSRSFSECSHSGSVSQALSSPVLPRSLLGALAPSPALSLHRHCPSHRPPHAQSTRLLGHVSPWGHAPTPLLSLLIPPTSRRRVPCPPAPGSSSSAALLPTPPAPSLKQRPGLSVTGFCPLVLVSSQSQGSRHRGLVSSSLLAMPRSPFPVVTAHSPGAPSDHPSASCLTICLFWTAHISASHARFLAPSSHGVRCFRGAGGGTRAHVSVSTSLSSAPVTPPGCLARPCCSPRPNHVLLTPDSQWPPP